MAYTSLSQVPGTSQYYRKQSFITGHDQGYIHVPGQVGSYAEWMAGGQKENALIAHRRATGLINPGPPTYFVPREIPVGASRETRNQINATNAAMRAGFPAPSAARSFGGAATGLAAGGTALARGGPAVGTIPGGGLGTVAAAGGGGLTSAGGLGLGGIGSSITNAGTGMVNTVKEYIPLAIKIGAAVIGIKILLWLVRKK